MKLLSGAGRNNFFQGARYLGLVKLSFYLDFLEIQPFFSISLLPLIAKR